MGVIPGPKGREVRASGINKADFAAGINVSNTLRPAKNCPQLRCYTYLRLLNSETDEIAEGLYRRHLPRAVHMIGWSFCQLAELDNGRSPVA